MMLKIVLSTDRESPGYTIASIELNLRKQVMAFKREFFNSKIEVAGAVSVLLL